jgi:hypothetical protein
MFRTSLAQLTRTKPTAAKYAISFWISQVNLISVEFGYDWLFWPYHHIVGLVQRNSSLGFLQYL